jgi:hypothetical protein
MILLPAVSFLSLKKIATKGVLSSFFLLFSSSGRKKPKEETPLCFFFRPRRGVCHRQKEGRNIGKRLFLPSKRDEGKQKEVLPKAILWKKKKKRRETNDELKGKQ